VRDSEEEQRRKQQDDLKERGISINDLRLELVGNEMKSLHTTIKKDTVKEIYLFSISDWKELLETVQDFTQRRNIESTIDIIQRAYRNVFGEDLINLQDEE
jgi:hypothetical protein